MAVYNHQKQGTLQSGDLTSGATALRILFAYMQEQGVNAKLDSAIRENPALLSTASTSSIAQKLYDELQADGVSSITLGQISQSLSASQNSYAAISKAIQTKGIAAVESDMVKEFSTLSQVNQGSAVTSGDVVARHARFGSARYLAVVSKPLTQDQCDQLAHLSEEATALAIVAALSGAEPVAIAFEAAALAYDAEASAGGCN